MAHRESIKEYLGKIEVGSGTSIVDWGRGTKPVTKYLKVFKGKYFGIDKLTHVGADLVADISLERFITLFDVAFCMECLEHVKEPDRVIQNVRNNLKEGGMFYFSVPFLYPVHSEEDYWRFTDQGMKLLLERNGFKLLEILPTEEGMGWVGKAIRLSTQEMEQMGQK